ncbi:MAG: hypothetical protein LBR05_10205 [Azoarcus sp.]|jgi:hypothetical protein|nr:hypothetical protein [Azoarcus sp.]
MNAALGWQEYCKTLALRFQSACKHMPETGGPAAMVRALEEAEPEWPFHYRLHRGGWYRLGGVVDEKGERVADSLEAWGEAALAAHDGDLGALLDTLHEAPLYATRYNGGTHYLVAPTGDGPADTLQLEIEELQETRAHRLGRAADGSEPSSLAELIDPPSAPAHQQIIAPHFFQFRRLTHIGSALERMTSPASDAAPIQRFLDDWHESSADTQSAFNNHWVIAFREYLDRYRMPQYRARPIPIASGKPPEFDLEAGANGLKLHEALRAVDREIGYPMAWFFHMLTDKAVPHWVARTAVEDALNGFAYLPQRDVGVVRNWLHRPYAV